MSAHYKTTQRRALQKLWSAFDQVISPYFGEGFLVGISGGPDSRALMEALSLWHGRNKCRFVIASLDHNQRSCSWLESKLVLARAQRLGFHTAPLLSLEESIQKNEEDLRKWRYDKLTSLTNSFSLKNIVLAHHKGDISEGFIMSLFGLGGGQKGEAMSAESQYKKYKILRPFLKIDKPYLTMVLSLLDQTNYVCDSTNESQIGARSWVRGTVLPTLQKFSPNLENKIASFSEHQRLTQEICRQQAEKITIKHQESFHIDLNNPPELIVYAIRLCLKKMCKNRDLRGSEANLKKIYDFLLGIDQKSNSFKLSMLNGKLFMFSGACAHIETGRITLTSTEKNPSFPEIGA